MKNKVTGNKSKVSDGWRNRIVGESEVVPQELMASPWNWRLHPSEQEAALRGVLDEVGWVSRVIVNKRTNRIVDGHLRVATAIKNGEKTVPVVYVDLSEEEEKKILLTLDPLAGMATMDEEKFRALLSEVEFASEDARKAVIFAGNESGVIAPDFQPVSADEQGRLDQKKPVQCPECGHEFTT